MTPEHDMSIRIALLERGQDDSRDAILSLRDSQKEISQSLSRLVALEERHIETRNALGRAFDSIDNTDKRLDIVERQLPALIEFKSIIFKCLVGIVVIVGSSIVGLVIK